MNRRMILKIDEACTRLEAKPQAVGHVVDVHVSVDVSIPADYWFHLTPTERRQKIRLYVLQYLAAEADED